MDRIMTFPDRSYAITIDKVEPDTVTPMVRVYKNTPETAAIQIRDNIRLANGTAKGQAFIVAHVNLTKANLRTLRGLIDEALRALD